MDWTFALMPQVGRAPALELSVAGSTLFVNGAALDLAPLQDGDVLPWGAVANDVIASDVTRTGDVIAMALRFPIRSGAPEAARFPASITVTGDGPAPLPANGD